MSEQKKVILTTFNIHGYYSLAFGYLQAYALKNKKLREKLRFFSLDFCVDCNDIYQVLYYFERIKPDIIGFSCYCWNMEKVDKLSALSKEVLPEAKVILGGPEVGPIAEEVLRSNPAVDVVVRGEGEVTFKELLEHYVLNKKSISQIKGISYRKGKKVFRNGERELIENLDDIPSPYLTGILPLRDQVLYLESYRGCPYKCAYCYEGKNYPHLRHFSKERIKKEVEFISKSGKVKKYSFVDPVFNLNKKKLREMCGLISQVSEGDVKLHTIEVCMEKVDKETVKELKKANVISVETGPQTVNEDTLKNINRYFERDKFIRGVKLLEENGIDVLCDLIIGLPGDNFFKFARSTRFVFNLKPSRIIFSTLHVLPGTYLFDNAQKFGLKFESSPPHAVIENETFSYAELRKAEVMAVSLEKEFNLKRALR
jgi:radical SAM superfamily enzyme YgiQ (UPF0313 family)